MNSNRVTLNKLTLTLLTYSSICLRIKVIRECIDGWWYSTTIHGWFVVLVLFLSVGKHVPTIFTQSCILCRLFNARFVNKFFIFIRTLGFSLNPINGRDSRPGEKKGAKQKRRRLVPAAAAVWKRRGLKFLWRKRRPLKRTGGFDLNRRTVKLPNQQLYPTSAMSPKEWRSFWSLAEAPTHNNRSQLNY